MKRYRDYNSYLREIFGERVQKIPLDAGLSCPNRDGTLSDQGCIFCDSRGSGTGAMIDRHRSIGEQIAEGRRSAFKRYGARKFIAYFQSFTNTYAPVERLKALYDQALADSSVVGLSVATRPDCVGPEVFDLLGTYVKSHLVWIEFGLQSAHDVTLSKINRGHDVACFARSVEMSASCGLNVCAHVILGLPGETKRMMLDTACYLGRLPVAGVKIHLLYVVKGTSLAALYEEGGYRCLEREEYIDLLVGFLELLPSTMVIHRLTGDPVRSDLVAPAWAADKSKNLDLIRRSLEEKNTWQGRKYEAITD